MKHVSAWMMVGLMLVQGVAVGRARADWPRWRGASGDGMSKETGWDPRALGGEPRVLWKVNVGKGYSSVSVVGRCLYTMGNVNGEDVVTCLTVESGETVWKHSYPCKPGSYAGPRSTPFVDGDRVYTASRDGQVFCLEAKTGAEKWKLNISSEFGARPPKWGHAGSPCVEGSMLILNGATSGVALDKRTGRKAWASAPGTGNYATPVVATIGSVRCAVIMGLADAFGVEVRSGRVLWSYPWKETSYDVNAADPIVSGGKVFLSSGYGKGAAVIDVTGKTPSLVWRNKRMKNHFSSSVLLDGYVYGIDGNVGRGGLACLEFDTGIERWRTDLGFGSLMVAANKLIVLNERGKLFVANAVPESYQQLASCDTMLAPRCWTAPVLCNGRIYCRNQRGDLICIDARKRKQGPETEKGSAGAR